MKHEVVLLALALCGPTFADSRIPADYTEFVTSSRSGHPLEPVTSVIPPRWT